MTYQKQCTTEGITKGIRGASLSDDGWRRRYVAPRRWRRRKRSVVGKEWQPPTFQDVGAGAWCSKCHIRHPYNGKDKCGMAYEMYDGEYTIMWLCPVTGQVISQLPQREG